MCSHWQGFATGSFFTVLAWRFCPSVLPVVKLESLSTVDQAGHLVVHLHQFFSFNGFDFVFGSDVYRSGLHQNSLNRHFQNAQQHGTLHNKTGMRSTLFYVLLVCGDVEMNPGPTYKYPCGTCLKPVKSNQMGLLCSDCCTWFHIKCQSVSSQEYGRLYALPGEPWS